jgi:hypothetical protein
MSLTETINHLNHLLATLSRDMTKVIRGNKAAAQRVRTGTIRLEKVAKLFRKESIKAEKSGKFKKKPHKKAKRRKR